MWCTSSFTSKGLHNSCSFVLYLQHGGCDVMWKPSTLKRTKNHTSRDSNQMTPAIHSKLSSILARGCREPNIKHKNKLVFPILECWKNGKREIVWRRLCTRESTWLALSSRGMVTQMRKSLFSEGLISWKLINGEFLPNNYGVPCFLFRILKFSMTYPHSNDFHRRFRLRWRYWNFNGKSQTQKTRPIVHSFSFSLPLRG